MARYFFDIVDGGLTLDDEGVEFADVRTASREALQSLPDRANSHITDHQIGEVTVTVRDDRGIPVYRATLTIDTEWLVEAPVGWSALPSMT